MSWHDMVSSEGLDKIHRIMKDVILRGFSSDLDYEIIEYDPKSYLLVRVIYDYQDKTHYRHIKTSFSRFGYLNHLVEYVEVDYEDPSIKNAHMFHEMISNGVINGVLPYIMVGVNSFIDGAYSPIGRSS